MWCSDGCTVSARLFKWRLKVYNVFFFCFFTPIPEIYPSMHFSTIGRKMNATGREHPRARQALRPVPPIGPQKGPENGPQKEPQQGPPPFVPRQGTRASVVPRTHQGTDHRGPWRESELVKTTDVRRLSHRVNTWRPGRPPREKCRPVKARSEHPVSSVWLDPKADSSVGAAPHHRTASSPIPCAWVGAET